MRHRLRDPVAGLLFVLPVLVLFLIFRIDPLDVQRVNGEPVLVLLA